MWLEKTTVPDRRSAPAFKREDLFEHVYAPPCIAALGVGSGIPYLVESDRLGHGNAEGENVPGPGYLVPASEDDGEEEDCLDGADGSFGDDVSEERVAVVDV